LANAQRVRNKKFRGLYNNYVKAHRHMSENHDEDVPALLTSEEFLKGDLAVFTNPQLRSRNAYSSELWVKKTTQDAVRLFQLRQCLREELERLRVESQRLRMWIVDEPNYIFHRIDTALGQSSLGLFGAWECDPLACSADSLLQALDIWYAHERVMDLKPVHAAMCRHMTRTGVHIEQCDVCAVRADKGPGSHWYNREIPPYSKDPEAGLPISPLLDVQSLWSERSRIGNDHSHLGLSDEDDPTSPSGSDSEDTEAIDVLDEMDPEESAELIGFSEAFSEAL
jgi:hypothetical protein